MLRVQQPPRMRKNSGRPVRAKATLSEKNGRFIRYGGYYLYMRIQKRPEKPGALITHSYREDL